MTRMIDGNDLPQEAWHKSSYSGGTGDNCIEVAGNLPGAVAVRDSKNPAGPAHLVPRRAWRAFITALDQGRLRKRSDDRQ